jgi:hypothetical protein
MAIAHDILETATPQPYQALRGSLRSGDILLFHGSSLFARLIQWATRSEFSHVAMVLCWDELERVMVIQSVEGNGVDTLRFSVLLEGGGRHQLKTSDKIIVARHMALLPEHLPALADFATKRLGAPYSWGSIMKIALRVLAGWVNVRLAPLTISADEYICSEFVAECLAQAGLQVRWDGLGFIAPSDYLDDPAVKLVGVIQT